MPHPAWEVARAFSRVLTEAGASERRGRARRAAAKLCYLPSMSLVVASLASFMAPVFATLLELFRRDIPVGVAVDHAVVDHIGNRRTLGDGIAVRRRHGPRRAAVHGEGGSGNKSGRKQNGSTNRSR